MILQSLGVMVRLLIMDMYVFRSSFIDKCINSLIYCAVQMFVMGYLMRSFGLTDGYINFFVVSLLATVGLFEVFPMVVKCVSDRTGDQSIMYYCTLPTLSQLVLLRLILFTSLGSCALTLFFFPIMATVLWTQGILFKVALAPLFVLIFLTCLFYGSLTLLFVTFVKDMTKISNVWMRFLFPLWFLGCYQFSWSTIHQKLPLAGYLVLLNPFTYINEGIRSVCLQGDYLPWQLCIAALAFFVCLFSYLGITRFKKQLDVV